MLKVSFCCKKWEGVLLGSSLFLSPHLAHNARSQYILQYRFPSKNMLGCFGKQEEKYWLVFFFCNAGVRKDKSLYLLCTCIHLMWMIIRWTTAQGSAQPLKQEFTFTSVSDRLVSCLFILTNHWHQMSFHLHHVL